MKKTTLNQQHKDLNAKMVDFAGWEMPLSYSSQIKEHNAVRTHAGVFDVSHMQVIDLTGAEAEAFLRRLLVSDAAKVKTNFASYSLMLNDEGGIIDDLIYYKLGDDNYRFVVNAACFEKDFNHMKQVANSFKAKLDAQDKSILAVQGPATIAIIEKILGESLNLESFNSKETSYKNQKIFIARTGYTGEDGVEVILENASAVDFWQDLMKNSVTPCGLVARDILRLEAGMHLYGKDMNETLNPFEVGLTWVVDLSDESRDFVGKKAILTKKEAGIKTKLTGLVLTEKSILREGTPLELSYQLDGAEVKQQGIITSATFSPILGTSIGWARIAKETPIKTATAVVNIRGKDLAVKLTKTQFVRNGKSVLG